MKASLKKILLILAVIITILTGYFSWLTLRPVEIVAIHHRSSGFSAVLVKNFPLTDKGKINWWLKNSKSIEKKYQIPTPDKDGSFYLTFWLFGEGYKAEGKYDRLCFKDMQSPINCIEKNRVFSVETGQRGNIFFTVKDAVYRMGKNGEIIKIKNE